MIKYSFIIPHKNSPGLLARCIKSIPDRDDIEIIVIDDNSTEKQKPIIERKNVILKYLDSSHSKGAGHARNIGIELAKGEWLLFADADDTYTDLLSQLLDSLVSINEDVVYFNHYVINGNNKNIFLCNENFNKISSDTLYDIQYGLTAPWNKAVRHSFLKKYDIRFEESPVGNDIMFTYQVAYLVRDNFRIIESSLYNYHTVANSITHKKNCDENYYLTILKHFYQCNTFLCFIGEKKRTRTLFSKMVAIMVKKGWSQFVLTLKLYLGNKDDIKREKNYYIDVVQQRVNL